MAPPHKQIKVQVWCRAGLPATRVFDAPGDQGEIVAGMQGIGVNTPRAASVAEATSGLAKDVHTPKDWMFTKGRLSIILAAGILLVITLFIGKTIKEDGVVPKVQANDAPIQTLAGIVNQFMFI